jgi:hypothetical protein
MCWSGWFRQKEGKPGSAEGQEGEGMSSMVAAVVVGIAATVVLVAALVVVVAVEAAVLVGGWKSESSCSPPGWPEGSVVLIEVQMEGHIVPELAVFASEDRMEGHMGLTVESGEDIEIVAGAESFVVVVVVVAAAVVVAVVVVVGLGWM